MSKRGIGWLLALVMVLGAAYAVPISRSERGAEVCVILCLQEQQCKQEVRSHSPIVRFEIAPTPASFQSYVPQDSRFKWPSSYPRPPTRSRLV